tara:strand:- start:717 stop:1319 length:603 start_codon:yes stop_codon:yes gene_type:complete
MENSISLSLSSIPTFLINLNESPERLHKSTQILNSINQPFQRFEGIKHSTGVIGCGLSHLTLLRGLNPMTLILEDDIGLTGSYSKEIKIPKDADAIYLGVSDHGFVRGSPFGHRGVVLASKHSEGYKRIYNMCSTHAIIYTSKRYIDVCVEVIDKCLKTNVAFDVGLASIHRHFNILTPDDPWLYQTEQPEFTKESLPLV